MGAEPPGSGEPVDLGQSRRRFVAAFVPGLGWDGFANRLDVQGAVCAHVHRFGYDLMTFKVDGLSGTATNARLIRDAIFEMEPSAEEPRVVLIGYSKGAPDILEAVVSYPEIRGRVAAVESLRPATRRTWLANNPLPRDIPYYSVVTLPTPEWDLGRRDATRR